MKITQKKIKDEKYKALIFIFVFFLFSLVCSMFSILCLYEWNISWFRSNFVLCPTIIFLLFLTIYGFSVWFVITRKDVCIKITLSAFILVIFALILVYVLLKTGFFEVFHDSEKLQIYLERAGIWMPLLYIILQFLQVIILPIPSVVSTVAGVALFGAFKTIIYSLLGILLGSFAAFFIGRKLGYRAVSWMIGADTLKKWQKKLKGKDNLFLTIMFVLPLFPDDILCFLAGLSSMSTRYFIIMICISRAIGIAGTCYSIDFIPFNTWWGILLWCFFLLAVVVLFVVTYKNLDKIQKSLKNLKKKK